LQSDKAAPFKPEAEVNTVVLSPPVPSALQEGLQVTSFGSLGWCFQHLIAVYPWSIPFGRAVSGPCAEAFPWPGPIQVHRGRGVAALGQQPDSVGRSRRLQQHSQHRGCVQTSERCSEDCLEGLL